LLHQSRLLESELKAIRSQMNPHFIFNVLNSIESYIMDNDKRTASRLVQKFASLSRLILENSTKSFVTADKEWKALTLYTELEAMRYNNSFTYNFIVDQELQLKTFLLPPMLVQPLIENAILHGLIVDQHPDAHLEVEIKKHDRDIFITVTDNGVGIENKSKRSPKIGGVKEKSIGLASIKERIEMINQQEPNANSSFEIKGKADGNGTIAILKLPIFNSEPLSS
jgi:LytS/YehU family sensor histidine kinase